MINRLINAIPLVLLGVLFFSCDTGNVLVLETYQTKQGWGYTIKKDDKIFIKQDFIPVLQGNLPFSSEDDAMKTGMLVLKKLKEQKHPSLSLIELDSLQIKYPQKK